MTIVECPECAAPVEIPQDVIKGEILSCPDCGVELEVEITEKKKIELQKLAIEKEDWGE